jgi:hypothetical protein
MELLVDTNLVILKVIPRTCNSGSDVDFEAGNPSTQLLAPIRMSSFVLPPRF